MALAGGFEGSKLLSALISLFRHSLPQPATAGAWDWTVVAGVPAILRREGCVPAVLEALCDLAIKSLF